MPRIAPASPDQYTPVFGPDPDLRTQVFAQAPEIAQAMVTFTSIIHAVGTLDARLVELVRLRVAFFNQCRTCMATRYADALDAGLTEQLVCSLEKPSDDPLLTERERVALQFADRFATDHLAVDDELFARLKAHFTDAELMELCFRLATFVGFGRMTAVLDIQPEDLPARFRGEGIVAPWGDGPVMNAVGVVSRSGR